MKPPIFRIATGPRVKKPSLLVADSVELFTDTGKVQTTGTGRKIDHTNPPVEINAVFDVRREKCHFSYAYQRKSIHSTSQSSQMGITEKTFLYSETVSFTRLSDS